MPRNRVSDGQVTSDSQHWAEAVVQELKDLQVSALGYRDSIRSLSEIQDITASSSMAITAKLSAIAKLAAEKNLAVFQSLLTIQGATDTQKLEVAQTLGAVERLFAENQVQKSDAAAQQVRSVLRAAKFPNALFLDTLTQKPDSLDWDHFQDQLAALFASQPELPLALYRATNWPLPLADWKQVREKELEEINELRLRRGFSAAEPDGLFGLAFSGGGIRSATFNLGILQGLASFGLLEKVDILSTVSGGGYIGAWLAGWIRRQTMHAVQADLASAAKLDRDQPQPKQIRFLREFSNYLTPRLGFFSIDTWTMAAVYFRNILLNQITLASLIGALMLIPRLAVLPLLQKTAPADSWQYNLILVAAVTLIYVAVALVSINLARATSPLFFNAAESVGSGAPFRERLAAFLSSLTSAGVQIGCAVTLISGATLACIWFWLNIANPTLHSINNDLFWWAAAGFFFLLSLLITWLGRSFDCVDQRVRLRKKAKLRKFFGQVLLVLAMVASSFVALVLLRAFLAVLAKFHSMPQSGAWHAVVWAPVLFMMVPGTAAIIHVGLLGTYIQDMGREWLTRFRAITHLWLFFWCSLASAAIYGPLLFAQLGFWLSGVLSLAWIGSTWSSLKAAQSALTGKGEDDGGSLLDLLAKVGPPIFLVGFLLFISLAEHIFLSFPHLGAWPLSMPNLIAHHYELLNSTQPWSGGAWPLAAPGTLFLVLLGVGMLLAWRVDINEFSMHHFYKNRLVRCYLGASNRDRKPNPFTGFDPTDDFSLAELKASKGYTGPYHIINANLNLSSGSDLAWQERKGASFVFTPSYCGFDVDASSAPSRRSTLADSAYRDTRRYAYPQGVPLGTAFAISGASADPNQGFNTSPAVAFLMTVFDVRLGWWMGNPRCDRESAMPSPRFGLVSLVSELLGSANDRSGFVSLSDGGHFDNTGLYELVRRRCRYIILCDAEQDPDYQFEGLGAAIRKCRIDFGAEIDIDPAAICPAAESKRSAAHCAVGSIQYRGGGEGTLLYIKASLTGDEPRDVLQYASAKTAFPHQPRSDQWFTESQFESYRALGYAAATAAIQPTEVWLDQPPAQDIEKFFTFGLRSCWYPENPGLRASALKHTGTLSNLLTHIASNSDLHDLGHRLFAVHHEFGPGGVHSPEEFYFVMVLLQLAEDVYFDLQLDRLDYRKDPRIKGWMKLFGHWANAPVVKKIWQTKHPTFRQDFQNFWNTLLDTHAPEHSKPPAPKSKTAASGA